MKVWKMATIKAERRFSKLDTMTGRDEQAEIVRAIRLRRKSEISRAGKP